MLPRRDDRHDVAIFRSGLLSGFACGLLIGICVATALALWSIYTSLPAALSEALQSLAP